MARLSIEQKWWIDPRRTFLQEKIACPGGIEVDGAMVVVWRMAQEYWAEGTLVPWRVFSKFRHAEQILAADLAELRNDPTPTQQTTNTIYELPKTPQEAANTFVYVRGSKDFFDWIFDIREKRRMAGKKSAQRPRDSHGRLLKKTEKAQQTTNKLPAKSNTHQLSGSGSGSGSSKDLVSTKQESLPAEPAAPPKRGHFAVKTYCDVWKKRYGQNPIVMPRDAKLLQSIVQRVGLTKFEAMLEAYMSMPEAWFIKKRHDVVSFHQGLNAVTQFLYSGKVVTHKAIKLVEEKVDELQGTDPGPKSISDILAEEETERKALEAAQ